jgi:hypothetical protein
MVKKLSIPFLAFFAFHLASCTPVTQPLETTAPIFVTTAPELTPFKETITELTVDLKPTTSATQIPTRITSAPTATPNIAATVVTLQQPKIYQSYPSPDDNWLAEVIIYDCVKTGEIDTYAYEQLILSNLLTWEERTADDQVQYCGGLGAFGLAGLFWSPHSQFFYYTNVREGFPGGCGYWERSIIRLDVTSLEREYLGAGPPSPDGEKIATWQGKDLVIWNVNGGETARIPALTDADTGPIAWSPDNQSLVYIQFTSYCPLSGKSFIVHLDVHEAKQTLLLESEKPTFGSMVWNDPDTLVLLDENGKQWTYRFSTQRLLP